MEKKKSNKLITITVLSLLIIVIIFTIYKINKNHEEKLYKVIYQTFNKCKRNIWSKIIINTQYKIFN